MKSFFYKTVFLGLVTAGIVDAYSLYDTSPAIGVPESYNIEYSATVRVGYDSNVNWAVEDEDDSPFVNASVRARYADMESTNKLTYDLKLGFTHYLDLDEWSSIAETRGDCRLTASMLHSFTNTTVLSSSLYASYSPQPDYAFGYTPTYCVGDMINTSFMNQLSHALDSRWSLTANAGFQSVNYTESIEQSDNRYYIVTGVGARYRESAIMTYKVDAGYTRELREEGFDSDRYTMTVGFQRALDPFSSCGADVGVQVRCYTQDTFVSPYVNVSYRRKLSEGFNAQVFLSYADENCGANTSYFGNRQSFLSNKSLRIGSRLSYILSPDVTYHCGINLIMCDYSDATRGAAEYSTSRYGFSVGMDYAFTSELRGVLSASYTILSRDYDTVDVDDANRWTVSAGATYNF